MTTPVRYEVMATPPGSVRRRRQTFDDQQAATAAGREARVPVTVRYDDGTVSEMCPWTGRITPEGWTISYAAE